MAYDIRLVKLVTGELVLGKYDAEKKCLNEVGILQIVPAQQGIQMFLLPYGHPFENKFVATLEEKNFLYTFSSVPQEFQDEYLKAITNLTIHGGLGNLNLSTSTIPASNLKL
ncbi:MAG: hypothetical protein IJU40_02875 [Desulfovibrionaceae bacterium]|nr:hypothetical protein [Desulfovibrionaceae bacterium]